MEKLVSSGLRNQPVPESYILPLEKRPITAPKYKTIPVIDLGDTLKNRKAIVREIIKASEEFGFFQVINHGVPEKAMKDMMSVGKEFFEMPAEDRMALFSEDPEQVCKLYTSVGTNYNTEETHFWRDCLRHPCHPVEDYIHLWPSKPTNYREVAQRYSTATRSLGFRLLELISEGLKIEQDYFENNLTGVHLMGINCYPPCPDPSLTLGLPPHCDGNLLTLLLQGDVSGLQVLYQEEWIAVEPLPDAFIINLGYPLKFISNGKLKSAEHRVVTNSDFSRTSITTLLSPSMDAIIQPAKQLLNEFNPPVFKPFKFADFLQIYLPSVSDTQGVLRAFML